MKILLKKTLLAILISVPVFLSDKLAAQITEHEWSLGFDFMGNILQGDFNNHPLSFSGDLYAKYDLASWVSACAALSYGGLKMNLDPNEQSKLGYPSEIKTTYSTIEIYAAIPFRTAGFKVEGYLGGGLMHFDPESSISSSPLPAIQSFSKNIPAFLFGIGFNFRLVGNLFFNAKTVFHWTSSDYLDYYPVGSTDKFTTFGAGLSYSFGGQNHTSE